jgi:hypothetical protein
MSGRADRRRARGIAELAPFLLAACTATLTTDAPKVVTNHPLPPFQMHQECLRLAPGDRLDYTFDSTEPVAFDIRYHDGNAVVMPIARERTRADAGVFAPSLAQDYCLMWEAGPAGALIDYRIRVRRADA